LDITLNVRHVTRRDTETNWTNKNPILLSGETGLVTVGDHAGMTKTGDGVTTWTNLPFDKAIANGGNSDTSTKLATGSKINGILFDGSSDITVPTAGAASGDLSGNYPAPSVSQASVTDTRFDNPAPAELTLNKIKYEFKAYQSIGLPAEASPFATIFSIRQWSDPSGGVPIRVAFTQDGGIYMQKSNSDMTAWLDWEKITISSAERVKIDSIPDDLGNIILKANETSETVTVPNPVDADMLGGNLPSYYGKQSDIDNILTKLTTNVIWESQYQGSLSIYIDESDWTNTGEYEDWPYSYTVTSIGNTTLTASDVNGTNYATVFFDSDGTYMEFIAPFCETVDGGIQIFSSKPTIAKISNIKIEDTKHRKFTVDS
jgi:hypothetical protein